MKTKLFCSFTSTIRLIHEGKVTEEDLARGFFAFGCARCHAFHPEDGNPNELTWLRDASPERQRDVHSRLVAALEAAEADGRAAWRPVDGTMCLGRINEMITAKGFDAIPGDQWMSNYPGYEEAVAASGQELEVAWR